jgi:hypothetical protein
MTDFDRRSWRFGDDFHIATSLRHRIATLTLRLLQHPARTTGPTQYGLLPPTHHRLRRLRTARKERNEHPCQSIRSKPQRKARSRHRRHSRSTANALRRPRLKAASHPRRVLGRARQRSRFGTRSKGTFQKFGQAASPSEEPNRYPRHESRSSEDRLRVRAGMFGGATAGFGEVLCWWRALS